MDKIESVFIFVYTMIHDVVRNKWTVTLSLLSYYYIYQFSKKEPWSETWHRFFVSYTHFFSFGWISLNYDVKVLYLLYFVG